ncbi:hypothetical protein CDEF62S_06320 [Castellaniella defragrans]
MNKRMALALGAALLAGCAAHVTPGGSEAPKRVEACQPIDEIGVAGLFDRWNASLRTGDPKAVVANYAERSILLPTLSGKNRITRAEKEDYFEHFLAGKPAGTVTARQIDLGCNMAADSGLYTFTMGSTGQKVHARYTYVYQWINGQWLITSHHSSLVPDQ